MNVRKVIRLRLKLKIANNFKQKIMKRVYTLILIILSSLVFSSCSNRRDNFFKHEKINTTFYVNEVVKAKYSRVRGFIIYNNIKVMINNGVQGYYYKDYNLTVGDKIESKIDIYYYSISDGYKLIFGDVDVSRYVKSK